MSITVRRVVKEFFEWADAALMPSTCAAYRSQLKKLPSKINNKQTHRLRPIDLTAWASAG